MNGAASVLREMAPKTRTQKARGLTAVGAALVVLWASWWGWCICRDSLVGGSKTWVDPLPILAGDFKAHIDHVARIHARGIDPYAIEDDIFCARFPYPPMIPRLFRWVIAFSPAQAAAIWLGAIALFQLVSASAAWQARQELALSPIPLTLIAAALMFSTPVVMAMERGQCDPLVIPAVLAAAALLRSHGTGWQLCAGGILGATAWLKYYPGIAIVSLLALRRWRAASAFIIVAAAIGAYDRVEVFKSIDNGRHYAEIANEQPIVHVLSHSVVSNWRVLTAKWGWNRLSAIPPYAAAAILLLPAAIIVSTAMLRLRESDALMAPYLLWMTAAATFAMPYANDYNLATLPLAALFAWDRRDPILVHAAVGLSLVWWQPFACKIGGEVLLASKLGALFALGYCLIRRSREISPAPRASMVLNPQLTGPGQPFEPLPYADDLVRVAAAQDHPAPASY